MHITRIHCNERIFFQNVYSFDMVVLVFWLYANQSMSECDI